MLDVTLEGFSFKILGLQASATRDTSFHSAHTQPLNVVQKECYQQSVTELSFA